MVFSTKSHLTLRRNRKSQTSPYFFPLLAILISLLYLNLSLTSSNPSTAFFPFPTKPTSSNPSLNTTAETKTNSLIIPLSPTLAPTPHPHDLTTAQINALLRTPAAIRLQTNPPATTRFLLYRAIGNDLPPRHSPNQSLENLQFILQNEPRLPGLERRWYLNRAVRPEKELPIIKLLISHNEYFTRNVLNYIQYSKIDFNLPPRDYFHQATFFKFSLIRRNNIIAQMHRDKNLFIIHNNQARNAMLRLGRAASPEYILPWDGNCFLNARAWADITAAVNATERAVAKGAKDKTYKYFAVNMARMLDNEPLKDPTFAPSSAEEEPQIIFHKTAKDSFNEKFPYGLRPKVELLNRLMVSGEWDNWAPSSGVWVDHRRDFSTEVPGPNAVQRIPWVARLFSGMTRLEVDGASNERAKARAAGLVQLLAEASATAARKKYGFSEHTLMWYDEAAMERNRETYRKNSDESLQRLVGHLVKLADEELANDEVYTVIDKPKPAPSRNIHDYLSVAPYMWPDSTKPDGIPFIHRDGMRSPASQLYSKESAQYDRTRFANFARNATILTLAGYFTGKQAYFQKAARQVRTWFIDEETRMNPHLKYAEVSFKWRTAQGARTGILDFVNIVIVLDAVRLLHKYGALSDQDMAALRNWVTDYGIFLQESVQGQREYMANNNDGTLFDAQTAAISSFVSDFGTLIWHTSLSRTRMYEQFIPNGVLKHEMGRRTQLHYMMFGLQAWVWLARMSERIGENLWSFGETDEVESYMERGMKFCVPYLRSDWSHEQTSSQDMSRMLFLYYHAKAHYPNLEEFSRPDQLGEGILPIPSSIFEVKPLFQDYDLVPPFWNLGTKIPS